MTPAIPDMNRVVGSHDLLFITLDTLRYDIAQREFDGGRLPVLASHLPPEGWQKCHSPASFTYAAHQAFFAGFLPTPARPGPHPRLFACQFPGSATTTAHTCTFAQDNLPAGLAARGYHTLCIGGVGFFNKLTALGSVLPGLFAESHWRPAFGPGRVEGAARQIRLAVERLQAINSRVFLFINVAAIHAPNRAHLPGCTRDNPDSHAAALRHVDAALAPLFAACQQRGPCFAMVCSDHGTAYGEDGYHGHRLGHPSVWDVPYAHFFIAPAADADR
ncbi:MAG: STM4013/SEN3800 family hydrolase [Candidatus Methylumidiphilus sp.]